MDNIPVSEFTRTAFVLAASVPQSGRMSQTTLSEFLRVRGYVGIRMEKNVVGHFEVQARVNGKPARLLWIRGLPDYHRTFARPSLFWCGPFGSAIRQNLKS